MLLHLYEVSRKYLKGFLRYREDTKVWAIINKVCKPELCFLCSAHPIIVLLHLYEVSRKYLKRFLRYREDTKVWAIINKVCKPELWFLCSAHRIIVLIMHARVMLLVFCPTYYCALLLYEVLGKYLKGFLRYRADTGVWWK